MPTFTFTPQPLPSAPDDYGDPEPGDADDGSGPTIEDDASYYPNANVSPNLNPAQYSNASSRSGPSTVTVNVVMDTETVATKVVELDRRDGGSAGYGD